MKLIRSKIKIFSPLSLRWSIVPVLLALQALLLPTTAQAQDEYLQCVPFARDLSGIQIYGDAHTWWKQAKGRYERGDIPQFGAVMSLKSHGKMQLGHVAVVSKVLDSRNILLSHSNWSMINGRRGQIERDVAAVDVSKHNDWSKVKIWYAPIAALGKTSYPVNGFIYPEQAPQWNSSDSRQWAAAKPVKKAKAPSRSLFAAATHQDLKRVAAKERAARRQSAAEYTVSEAPVDLIAELISNTGS